MRVMLNAVLVFWCSPLLCSLTHTHHTHSHSHSRLLEAMPSASTPASTPAATSSSSTKKVDPKVRNLFIFVTTKLGGAAACVYGFIWYTQETDLMRLTAYLTLGVLLWRVLLSVYRRMIVPPKNPLAYGKWAIVTGSTRCVCMCCVHASPVRAASPMHPTP